MATLRNNLLVRFAVLSFVFMVLLVAATGASMYLNVRHELALLGAHGAAMMSGTMILPDDPISIASITTEFQRVHVRTLVALVGGLMILYAVSVHIVWRGWLVIKRQQDSLRKANDDLERANSRLARAMDELHRAQRSVIRQERLRALGEMASGIAHNLNNVLTPIVGMAELIRLYPERFRDKAQLDRSLEAIEESAVDAASIVARFRDFNRPVDPDEDLVPVDLNELVERVIAITEPRWKSEAQAAGANIAVETDLGILPTVMLSQGGFRESLTNLIFNAVAAMPDGGRLMIATRVEGDSIILEVEDTGIGMDEEARLRCMEPFYTTKPDHGTGLGLSTVHGVVERHNGWVAIKSEVGVGTTVTIAVPNRIGVSVGGQQEGSAALRPLKILAVDDVPSVLSVISQLLEQDGHAVQAESSPERALQRFGEQDFDVVVLDRAMPVLNGDQLARIMKDAQPAVPVIMLTGFGDMMNAKGELPAGVDKVIGKPPTTASLRDAFRSVLPGQGNVSAANA